MSSFLDVTQWLFWSRVRLFEVIGLAMWMRLRMILLPGCTERCHFLITKLPWPWPEILVLEIKNRKDKKILARLYSDKKYPKTKYNHLVHTYMKVHAASTRRHCENPGAKCSPDDNVWSPYYDNVWEQRAVRTLTPINEQPIARSAMPLATATCDCNTVTLSVRFTAHQWSNFFF